jgi:putative addiction module CopG family antidote
MKLSLPPEVEELIAKRVGAGAYATPEEVVSAGVRALEQQESFGDFVPEELDELLAEGERDIERGDVLDADEVFAELRRMSEQRRRSKAG